MKKLSVAEYARRLGKNESTIRKQISAGKLQAITERVNNRKVYMVLVDEESEILQENYQTVKEKFTDLRELNQEVQEAEIIQESSGFQMFSIEKESFDLMLTKFETMSNDRANTLESSLKLVQEELFQIKADNKKLQEELLQEKIKAAQIEAESKIKDIKIKELEEKLRENKAALELMQISLKENETVLNSLKSNLNIARQENEIIKQENSKLKADLKESNSLYDKQNNEIDNSIAESQQLEEENLKLKKQIDNLTNEKAELKVLLDNQKASWQFKL